MMKKNVLILMLISFSIISCAQGIQFDQLQNWTGSGSNVAMFVVDFNDGTDDCFAFGFRFDGNKTAGNMIFDVAFANPELSADIGGGFLNDIIYGSHSGIGGSPYYWSTFVFNGTDWEMNWDGTEENLTDSMFFACSYTDWYQGADSMWYPVELPQNPQPAPSGTGMTEGNPISVVAYPNPFDDILFIVSEDQISYVELFDVQGRLIIAIQPDDKLVTIDACRISSGLYLMKVSTAKGAAIKPIVRK